MVRFGSGTIELERIRPRRIPRHFFWHELELPGDAGGKKRKRKKARGSGGEGTRWDEVKGRPAIHHHAWSPALTTARYRCVFLPKLHFATFSNPHAEIVPNFSIDPQSHSRSKIGTREMGSGPTAPACRVVHATLSFRPTFSSSRIDTRIQLLLAATPSLESARRPCIFINRESKPWKTRGSATRKM